MDSTAAKNLIREDSLEEFEFCDYEGDLNVDLSKSPIHGGRIATARKGKATQKSVALFPLFMKTLRILTLCGPMSNMTPHRLEIQQVQWLVAERAGAGLYSVISVISSIVEQQGIVVTIPTTTLATSAVGAITGSVLGGPPGLAVGLLTGAILGYCKSPKKANSTATQQERCSIRQILNQMTLQQKKELLKELLGCLKHSNVRSLILEILKNEGIRNMALDILSGFLMKKMGVTLIRPK